MTGPRTAPTPAPTTPPPFICERDDGRYQIGITDEAPGPFESRRFAEAVAIQSGVS